jgi:hypothetical protein
MKTSQVDWGEEVWTIVFKQWSGNGTVMVGKLYTSMAQAIQELKKRGFTANFEFVDQAFRDVNSGKTFKAEDLAVVEHYRFEEASDPDDMSIVYALKSNDGTRGTIADAYGVYANPQLAEFLTGVTMQEESWVWRLSNRLYMNGALTVLLVPRDFTSSAEALGSV